MLVKTGKWYHGGMARPVALDVRGEDTAPADSARSLSMLSTHGASPPREKKAKKSAVTSSATDGKPDHHHQHPVSQSSGHQGRDLRRQYSLVDVRPVSPASADSGILHAVLSPDRGASEQNAGRNRVGNLEHSEDHSSDPERRLHSHPDRRDSKLTRDARDVRVRSSGHHERGEVHVNDNQRQVRAVEDVGGKSLHRYQTQTADNGRSVSHKGRHHSGDSHDLNLENRSGDVNRSKHGDLHHGGFSQNLLDTRSENLGHSIGGEHSHKESRHR